MTKKNIITPFSHRDVEGLVKRFYGLDVAVKPLVSYIDYNFLLQSPDGTRYVFKIANEAEHEAVLDGQNKAMGHLERHMGKGACPHVIPTPEGKEIIRVTSETGTQHMARLLSYLPGRFLAELKEDGPYKPELLTHLGTFLGQMSNAFSSFEHPALHRYLIWDPRYTMDLEEHVEKIKNIKHRNMVKYLLLQFKEHVSPVLPRLRTSIIHSDGNDYNVLADAEGKKVTGIIDFGDMIYSCTLFELANATAYMIHHQDDPLETAAQVLAAFHNVFPLTQREVDVLYYMLCSRLCYSLTQSARQMALEPENTYLEISVAPAAEVLERMIDIDPLHAQRRFRRACGMPAPDTPEQLPPETIVDIRKKNLNPALSLSYSEPLKIVRGYMQYLYDHKGGKYLDTVNNVCHVGHCHPDVVKAGQYQMALLNTNTRYLHDHIARYAEELCATLPEKLCVCFLTCTGSEANELALRMARTHTKQKDFIVLDHAYHGNTNAVIEISPYKFDGPGGAGKPDHVHKALLPDGYRGPYKGMDAKTGKTYAIDVQRALMELEENNKKPAAFIHESIAGVAGQIFYPDTYLQEAYKHVRAAGGVCIADEVQVGFGRVGSHMWGFQTQNVVPDIVTMGKPIGNGHPLAAVVTTREIADSFNNGMEYFNTFGGNPVSCAIGRAVLKVIQTENLRQNALEVGTYMLDGLKELQKKHPLIGDVRGLGLFIGIELVKDPHSLEPARREAKHIADQMKARNILISVDGPFHNVLKIKPPIVFTKQNADSYINALDDILS